jgi:uncharacterized protein YceH (UPF0502 family)
MSMRASSASRSPVKNASAQLNVRIKQDLAERLRERAEELHSNPGALVAQAIEQLLAQSSPAPSTRPQSDLEQRLGALEDRIAALETSISNSDSQ